MRTALNWTIAFIGAALIIFVIIAAYGGYRYTWTWVGVSELRYTKTDQEEIQQAKTLWDWLSLLIIPFILAIGAYFFRQAEKQTDEEIAKKRREQEQAIANDNLQETTLQTYLDRMSELLLGNNSTTPEPNQRIQNLARARTITTVNQLNAERKGTVLLFLHESNLINKEGTIVNLEGANLIGANLEGANLEGANLTLANLEQALLRGANLIEVKLEGANLKGANLEGANLIGANLTLAKLNTAKLNTANLNTANLEQALLIEAQLLGAHLLGAQLERAKLKGAKLEEAFLRGANLRLANLYEANLRGANLTLANLTHAFLERAKLEGAKLEGAKLEGAKLEGAAYNNKTQWPEGFTPPVNAINTDLQKPN